MNAPIIAFFNNKGGVGKTSLVYHLTWMYYDLGLRVLAADLDPQANLTAAFLDEDRLEAIWEQNSESRNTIFECVQPLLSGLGDIAEPQLETIEDGLSLLVGDLKLSGFEDELSSQWPDCLDRKERAFRVISAFWRILDRAGRILPPVNVILVDLGPNLGAINRAALIAADYVVVPLSPDLFSLQGLKNLGPTLKRWRGEWQERVLKNPAPATLPLPPGKMDPIGYVILQHGVRFDRPVQAWQRWIERIPALYQVELLSAPGDVQAAPAAAEPHRLALLKHYQSLMPMSQEARKPIFHLKPADGVVGAHGLAVQRVRADFRDLARAIATRVGFLESLEDYSSSDVAPER